MTLYDYMQEVWRREAEAEEQELAELADAIRREQEEYRRELARELEY